MKNLTLIVACCILPVIVQASSSQNFSNNPSTFDSGGERSTSANYSGVGSVGGITGYTLRNYYGGYQFQNAGFIGELYEIYGYGLLASDDRPAEGTTFSIYPIRKADDGTIFIDPPGSLNWSAQLGGGPLASISADGIVTAGLVYKDSSASIDGLVEGEATTLYLLVRNTIPDNFGTYAGDGLPDEWQERYFGLDNPLAAPLRDASGTGQNNLFKYIAGLDPLDPNAVFRLRIESVTSQPGQKRIVFGPVLADRNYTVKAKTSLTDATWLSLGDSLSDGFLPERGVIDRAALGAKKFYHIEITKP